MRHHATAEGNIPFTAEEEAACDAAESARLADYSVVHTACCDKIDALRDEKIAAGCPYVFPDALTGTIQLRDQKDIANVHLMHSGALARVVTGDTTTIEAFRDAENVDHNLTPAEMLTMASAAMAYGRNVYLASHAHKNALMAICEGAGTDAEKVAALAAYDITAGW